MCSFRPTCVLPADPCTISMATSRVRPVGVSAAVVVHAVAAGTMASRNGSAMLAPIPFSTVRRGRHFLAMKGMMSSSSESLL